MSSVTLRHCAKAVGWNEMPFCRDTLVFPSNILLDKGFGPPREGKILGVPPVCSDVGYCQTTFNFEEWLVIHLRLSHYIFYVSVIST